MYRFSLPLPLLCLFIFLSSCQNSKNVPPLIEEIEAVKNEFQVCQQPYALCTSAPCIPHPTDTSITLCQCDIINSGAQVSLSLRTANGKEMSCDDLAPFGPQSQFLYSTYSTQQEVSANRKFMSCDSQYTWSNCLNQLCVINPDKVTATCFCLKVTEVESVTLGGRCDTSTCGKKLWSAATAASANQATAYLNTWLRKNNYPDSMLVKSAYCQE